MNFGDKIDKISAADCQVVTRQFGALPIVQDRPFDAAMSHTFVSVSL